MSRVRFRPGLLSSGFKRPGFGVQGSNRPTSTSSGFKMDFFLFLIQGQLRLALHGGAQGSGQRQRCHQDPTVRDLPELARGLSRIRRWAVSCG